MLRWIACLTVVMTLTACERTATIAPTARADEPVAVGAAIGAPTAEPVPTQAAAQPTAEAGGGCGEQCGEGGECGGSCGCNQIPARAPRTVPATATWTELEVQGMRCGGCAKKIEAAVAGIEGVYDVRADFRSGTVRFAAENDIRQRVAPRIAALGYRVQ